MKDYHIGSGISLVKHNIKVNLGKNYLAAGAVLIILPFISGFRLIEERNIMRIMELFMGVFGMILIGNIMECREGSVEEVIRSKRADISVTFLIRLGIGIAAVIAVSLVICIYGIIGKGTFNMGVIIYGGVVTALTVGMVCVTIYNISNNIIMGYLVSVGYFFLELLTRGKYTKEFYLFQMLSGNIDLKWKLLVIDIVLIGINIFILKKKKVRN